MASKPSRDAQGGRWWRVLVRAESPPVYALVAGAFDAAGLPHRMLCSGDEGDTYRVAAADQHPLRAALGGLGVTWRAEPDGEDAARILVAEALRRSVDTVIGYVDAAGAPRRPVPVLQGHEFVAHVAVGLGRPRDGSADYEYVRRLWRACVTRFGLDRPIADYPEQPPPRPPGVIDDEPYTVLAAAESPGGGVTQLVLRRVRDMLCLSFLRAPEPGLRLGWAALDAAWDAVLPAPTPGVLGSARILQARVSGEGPPDPEALRPLVVEQSGFAADTWDRGVRQEPARASWADDPQWDAGVLREEVHLGPFAVWEAVEGEPGQLARDGRAERRLAVVAPAAHDAHLSAWTWSFGADLPRFARYLLQAARIRHGLRVLVREGLPSVTRNAVAAAALLDPLIEAGRAVRAEDAAWAVDRLDDASFAAAKAHVRATELGRLRASVASSARNMRALAEGTAPGGLFTDDERVAEDLARRAQRDLDRLDHALRGLRRRIADVDPLVPGWRDRVAVRTPVTASPLARDQAKGLVERVVQEAANFHDPWTVVAGLGRTIPRVCRITVTGRGQAEQGTGVLVGPDLVLTCRHVVEGAVSRIVPPSDIRCAFDFAYDAESGPTDDSRFRLAADWLVAASPVDPDELDYAVIRLDGKPGHDTMNVAGERGWVELPAASPAPEPGERVAVIGYPRDFPIKMDIGDVLRVYARGRRLDHRANTVKGHSGSPCLNLEFALVALHRGGSPDDPDANVAVPIAAIARDLEATGHGAILVPTKESP